MIIDCHVGGWKAKRATKLLAVNDFTADSVAIAKKTRSFCNLAIAQKRANTRRGNDITALVAECIYQRNTKAR
ncbi:hypothetical protein D3C79_1073500 [compost metagenome]